MSWRCPPPPEERVRVALVASEIDVVTGLMRRLAERTDLHVVGSFGSMASALSGLPAIDPDVVLIDRELADGQGGELCARLRQAGHQVACLVLASVPLAQTPSDAIDGVVLKSLTGDLLEREVVRLGRQRSADLERGRDPDPPPGAGC